MSNFPSGSKGTILVTASLAGQDRNHIDFSMCKVKLLLNVLIYDAFQTAWAILWCTSQVSLQNSFAASHAAFFSFSKFKYLSSYNSTSGSHYGNPVSIRRCARTHYDFSSLKGRGYVLESYLPTENPGESKAPTLSPQDCGDHTWVLMTAALSSYNNLLLLNPPQRLWTLVSFL